VRRTVVGAAAVLLVAGAFGAGTRYAFSPARSGEPPLCPAVWRPTSIARTLGPRETVSVVAVDLDGDGRNDAVFANQLDESLSIYWGDGTARLGSPDTLPVGRVSSAPAVGDVDGDGLADLLVPDADKSELRVYRQEAARRFVAAGRVEHADLSPIGAPALVNWNGDGMPDLAVLAEGGVKVRLGLGGGAFSTDQVIAELGLRPFAVVRRTGAPDALLVGGSDGADLVEPGPGGVARRTRHWNESGQPMTAGSGPDLLLRRSASLVQLLPDGSTCLRGPAAAFQDVFALSDMDGDGTPEGLGVSSCAGCTSNHVVVSGG
jgi:hypothetical protein